MNKQNYPNHYELKVKRKAILEYYGHKCYLCNNEATQVHHIDENRGNHNVYNLVPLCHKCHRMVHKKENKNKNYFSNFKAPNALNIPKIKGKDNDEDKHKILLHFRASDVWIQGATARAEKLGLSLSEYIRSTISKDCEEVRMRREKFIKEYTISIDNYFDTLRPAEKKAIKKAIWDYEIDLDINPDVNMYDIFGPMLEMLPIDRPLSPTMEEEIDNMIKERLQELKKEYKKEVWVLMNPDSELWNEETAHEELERLSKKWWVKIAPTSKTRDEGHGQEWLFIVSGDPEAVREFEKELELGLY